MIDVALEKLDSTDKVQKAKEDFKVFIEEQLTQIEDLYKKLDSTRKGLLEITAGIKRLRTDTFDEVLKLTETSTALFN